MPPMHGGDLEAAAAAVARSRRLVVFTGAGMSKESGIDTFRGKGGIWERVSSEDVATLEGFIRDPERVWRWNDARRQHVAGVDPHEGYRAIVRLESLVPEVTVVTQNIDGLHRLAGSSRVVELHGNIWKVRCAAEDNEPWEDRRVPMPELPPRCGCGGLLRPHIVWFGEPLEPEVVADAQEACSTCDTMLVVGTSAIVYPAAGMPLLARRSGAFLVEVNPEETPLSDVVDCRLAGTAREALPPLVEAVAALKGG